MTSDSEQIMALLRELKPTLQKEFGIKRLRVFGSVARGDAGPQSDVDLIADFAEAKPNYFLFLDIRDKMQDSIGRTIDLFTENGIDKFIRQRVLREAKDV